MTGELMAAGLEEYLQKKKGDTEGSAKNLHGEASIPHPRNSNKTKHSKFEDDTIIRVVWNCERSCT